MENINLHHWREMRGPEFRPKNLVYRGGPETAPESESPKRDPMEELRALRAEMESGNDKLRKELQQDRRWKKRTYLDLEKTRKPRSAKAEKAMEDFLKWETAPEEVDRMQRAHELIYLHYLNPNFTLYINLHKPGVGNDSFAGEVFSALDKVVENPYDFRYTKGAGNGDVLEIRGRDNDMLIRFEGGNIRRIKTGNLDQTFSVGKGTTPWLDSKGHQEEINRYTYRLKKEFGTHPTWKRLMARRQQEGWSDAKYVEEVKKAFPSVVESMNPALMEIAQENHQRYIRKLKTLIDKRDFGFEKQEPAYSIISGLSEKPGIAYMLKTSPRVPNGYIIQPKGTDGLESAVIVSREGYLMRRNEEGKWVVDPRYEDLIKNRYYEDHPKDRAQLGEEGKEKLDTQAANREQRNEELRQTARASALKDAIGSESDVEKIKQVVLIMVPNTPPEQIASINQDNIDFIKKKITGALPKASPEMLSKMEDLLGIEPPPAPTSKQERTNDLKFTIDNSEVVERTMKRLENAKPDTLKAVGRIIKSRLFENDASVDIDKMGEKELRSDIERWLNLYKIDKAPFNTPNFQEAWGGMAIDIWDKVFKTNIAAEKRAERNGEK